MPLHFSNATNDVIDISDSERRNKANDPNYRYDPITKEFVLKTVPVIPVVPDQSGRADTEGDKPRTVTTPHFNPQAERGKPAVSTGLKLTSNLPASIFAKSRISSIIFFRLAPLRCIL